MKAYFILRDFFSDAYISQSARIKLKSYKIDNIETLTNVFFIDTQSIPPFLPSEGYDYCRADESGTSILPPSTYANSFNPFGNDFKLAFDTINGFRRGQPTGTLNGNDYGAGIMNFGVDKNQIFTGYNIDTGTGEGIAPFFVNIDFSKSLYIEFDLLTNIVNGQVYENPQIVKTYKIIWDYSKCYREFSYYSHQTQQIYQDFGNGFLFGYTKSDAETKGPNFPYLDFSAISCGQPVVKCDDKERTRSFAMFVNIPKAEEQPETIKECCYLAKVLAQTVGNDYEKNDFTGVFHKRQISGETADFVLVNVGTAEETILDNNDFGIFKDFGDIPGNPDLKTFVLEWKKVLTVSGPGTYTIIKRATISGIDFEEREINYDLREYSTKRADKTVRMDAKMDGFMERLNVDFKNSGFTTSLRFKGFFGRRTPKTEEDNIVYSNFVVEQISMKQTNEYTMQSSLLPYCMTSKIWDFMHFANDIYYNDYNLNNHIRDIIRFPVKLADNKEPGYSPASTKAILNFTYTEKKINNVKRNY